MTAAREVGHTLLEADWLQTPTGHLLHHAPLTAEQTEELGEDATVSGDIRLTCGRFVAHVTIPGPFTRMGARRCALCCDRLGYPQGVGSPKNDDACQSVLVGRR